MAHKEFAVFGLGNFGRSVAETLANSGCEVLAVDKDEEKINDIAGIVTYAVKADVTDQEVLQNLGIRNMDAAVVAIADDLEASIMATILSKELGVPYVIAKAQSEMHANVLRKVGADEVIRPEREMGARLAHNMISGNFIDLVELSSTFSMVEMQIPKAWEGKTMRELGIRDKFGVNVIGIKKGDAINVNLNPDTPMQADESVIMVGDNQALKKLK